MSIPAFVDVSFTDGACAAWGERWRSAMLAGALERLAGAGLAAIEVLNPAVIAQAQRRGENPLERLAPLRGAPTALRCALALRPDHGRCDLLAGAALTAVLRMLARHGVGEVLLIDPLLDLAALREALHAARDAGLVAIAALPYRDGDESDDPWHAALAAQLAAAGADRVMLRDEAGLLHAERLTALAPALQAALATTPLDLHTRCQTGLGPQVVLEAVRLGVARIDAALPCVANGASVPSLPLLLRSAALLGLRAAAPDREALAAADAVLAANADQEGLRANRPWAFDLAPYRHQLPGDVAGEVLPQLPAHRHHAFGAECERIRAEFGGVPMLAPFARAIARQALAHLGGEPRYATLQPALRRLLQGAYGDAAALPAALRERVGTIAAPRFPGAPADDDAALTLIGGVEPAARARPASLRHEALAPEQALARGLAERFGSWATLEVSGPGLALRLAH